jgi:hypothetical protein
MNRQIVDRFSRSMKRVPMNPYSQKGRRKAREHSAMSKRVLAEEPFCACGCGAPSTDAHHILKRSSGGTNERSNYRGMAHDCHMWIHQTQTGMRYAYAHGLMRRANRVED